MPANASSLELDHLTLGDPITVEVLTLFPMIVPANGHPRGYLTLDEAFEKGLVEVGEIGGGTVPEILVTNKADLPILLTEGDQLIGAKQNRTLNISILTPAHATQSVPVSCVEAGRWAHRFGGFRASEHCLFLNARRAKMSSVSANLRAGRAPRSDQREVWDMVLGKLGAMNVESSTSAMEEIYVQHRRSKDTLVDRLQPVPGQVGALVTFGRSVEGLDLFDHPETWQRLWRKVLSAYAIDALEPGVQVGEAPVAETARAYLDRVRAAGLEPVRVGGLGEHLLLRAEDIDGFALRHKGRVVHLFAYAR